MCVFCSSICNFWNLEGPPKILISSCFKMLLLGVSKLRTTYILPPGWCIYSFQPFLGFCFESFQWGRYSFCFIRICYCFTVWNHDVLLDYMGTPQWELHGDNFTQVPTYWVIHLQLNLDKLEVTVKSILLIYRTPWKADLQDLWACTVSVVAQGHIFLLYSREI